MYERVSKAVAETLKSGLFPLVLAGDHSTAGGTIAGIRIAKPKNRLGVIWIDAHADMHSPYTTPSGNMHGMPLATALGEDNIENQVHNPDPQTIELWNKLKNIGKIQPKISPEDIVFIGLRDYEKEEEYLIKKYGMKVITVQEVRRKGVENIVRQAMMHLSSCDDIYVSFDVDSLDSSISRGTGTPVSNGLKEKEVEDMLASIMQNHKICCFEVTEVNPTLDKENMMAEIAFNILQRSVNLLLMN
jgi:arginase